MKRFATVPVLTLLGALALFGHAQAAPAPYGPPRGPRSVVALLPGHLAGEWAMTWDLVEGETTLKGRQTCKPTSVRTDRDGVGRMHYPWGSSTCASLWEVHQTPLGCEVRVWEWMGVLSVPSDGSSPAYYFCIRWERNPKGRYPLDAMKGTVVEGWGLGSTVVIERIKKCR